MAVESKVYCWDLMRCDDLCKCLVLDTCLRFTNRKIYKDSILPNEAKTIIEKYMNEHFPFNDKNLKTISMVLLDLVKKHKICYTFNVTNLQWVHTMLQYYLQTLSINSLIIIVECNRYIGDNYKGVMAKAKINIAKGTKLSMLSGIYKALDNETKDFLESQGLDFSVMKSNMTKENVIMLGPAALINHDCNPNCAYESVSKSSIHIKIIRNILAGQELLCFYGSDYFGVDNEGCACQTCEKRKQGIFMEKNVNFDNLHVTYKPVEDNTEYIILKNPMEINKDLHESYLLDISISTYLLMCSSLKFNSFAVLNNKILTSNLQLIMMNPIREYKYEDWKYYLTNSYLITKTYNVIINYNLDKHLASISLDSSYSLNYDKKNYYVQNNCNIMGKSESSLIKWCETCYKGTIVPLIPHLRADNEWHSSECSGIVKSRCNNLPRVILKYPEKLPQKRRPFCQFCASFVHQYPRHIEKHHSDEKKVKEMMKAASYKKRLNILTSLRNRGLGVYYNLTGIIVPCRSIKKLAENVEKVQCNACGSFFSKKTLWCHACPNKT